MIYQFHDSGESLVAIDESARQALDALALGVGGSRDEGVNAQHPIIAFGMVKITEIDQWIPVRVIFGDLIEREGFRRMVCWQRIGEQAFGRILAQYQDLVMSWATEQPTLGRQRRHSDQPAKALAEAA